MTVLVPGLLQGFSQDNSCGCSRLKACLGLEALLPRWGTHLAGNLVLAVGKEDLATELRKDITLI